MVYCPRVSILPLRTHSRFISALTCDHGTARMHAFALHPYQQSYKHDHLSHLSIRSSPLTKPRLPIQTAVCCSPLHLFPTHDRGTPSQAPNIFEQPHPSSRAQQTKIARLTSSRIQSPPQAFLCLPLPSSLFQTPCSRAATETQPTRAPPLSPRRHRMTLPQHRLALVRQPYCTFD